VSIELGPRAREAKPLYVLVPLLFLNLTLLSLQIEEPGGSLLLRRWVVAVSAPILNLSAFVSRGAWSTWSEYVWLRGAREENSRLHQTLQQFALRDRSLEQIKEENFRLRKLLAFSDLPARRSIGARVVGRTPAYLSNVLYLDRGSADGVAADMPVVSAGGVVGRVVLVSSRTAQVQLLTNADASIGGMIEKTRSPGVARGSGGPLLELDYIGNTEPVEVGDLVLTSGLDGIFPKGLPIGKVVESAKGRSVFRLIRVEPVTDVLRLEEVLILLPRPAEPDPPGGAPQGDPYLKK
jgi:rod shape-determining protein MreC